MSNYRRLYEKGCVYFFTVVTHGRAPILCEEKALLHLKQSFQYVKTKYPFRMNALVILPDHLHCIWQLPDYDADFSKRWNLLKRYFSLKFSGETNHHREKNIWQKRFWEHLIRNDEDFKRCFDYIHFNPVKHGYVDNPIDWPYSTFKENVIKGFYEVAWGNKTMMDTSSIP